MQTIKGIVRESGRITSRKKKKNPIILKTNIVMEILYALSQEASLQITIKCHLNTVSAKVVESTTWWM